MSEFESVGPVDEIPLGQGKSYSINGKLVAVFRLEDGLFAISDACPHMGASLAGGFVEDGGVTCPWHGWRFCVHDGSWLDNPTSKLRTASYPVRVVDGQVEVAVTPPPRESAS